LVAPFVGDESVGPTYTVALAPIAQAIRKAAANEALFNQERDIIHPFL